MEDQPKVSILMPVYNAERYLNRSLHSALCQTFSDLEVVCVNDGSTDGSLPILRAHAAEDGRVRIISRENYGTLHARVTAVRAARGQFLFFLDADDAFELDIVERAVAAARETGADVVEFGVKTRKYGTFLLRKYPWGCSDEVPEKSIFRGPQILARAVAREANLLIYNRLIRRSTFLAALEEISPEMLAARIVYSEDLLLCLAVAKHAQSSTVIHGSGYRYLRRLFSVTYVCQINYTAFCKKLRDECLVFGAIHVLLPDQLRRMWIRFHMAIFCKLLCKNSFSRRQNMDAFCRFRQAMGRLPLGPAVRNECLTDFLYHVYRRCLDHGRFKRRCRMGVSKIRRYLGRTLEYLFLRLKKCLFCHS
jgi:glycosyltransferase involved in cell wall biosynthesis